MPWRTVPAFEDVDQPLRVAGARWGRAPVGVRQQQIDSRRSELEQCLIGGDGVIGYINRAQDPAVAITEFRRLEQVQAISDGVETITAVRITAMPPSGLGVAVQANAHADAQALERFKHGVV